MSKDLLVVKPEDSLERVDQLFSSYTIHHLPVVNEDGKLVGILSKSDVTRVNNLMSFFTKKYYDEVTVGDIMTRQVTTVSPDERLDKAARVFQGNQFHAMPVVKNKKLEGIITTHDIIDFCCENIMMDED